MGGSIVRCQGICILDICLLYLPSLFTSFEICQYAHVYTKDVINSLGGIQVLFPLLETTLGADIHLDSSYLSLSPGSTGRNNSVESDNQDWEMLPSSSFSDWKLEKNPVSGFLTLIKNFIINHPLNQEQLMRGKLTF